MISNSINLWYFAAPALWVSMALLGVFSVTRVACHVKSRWDDSLVMLLFTAPSTFLMALLILRESSLGILQAGLNTLTPGESEIYGVLVAICGYIVIVAGFAVISMACYILAKRLTWRFQRELAKAQCRGCRDCGHSIICCPVINEKQCPVAQRRTYGRMHTRSLRPILQDSVEVFAEQKEQGLLQITDGDDTVALKKWPLPPMKWAKGKTKSKNKVGPFYTAAIKIRRYTGNRFRDKARAKAKAPAQTKNS